MAAEARRMGARGLGKKALKRRIRALASWHADVGWEDVLLTRRMERIVAGEIGSMARQRDVNPFPSRCRC